MDYFPNASQVPNELCSLTEGPLYAFFTQFLYLEASFKTQLVFPRALSIRFLHNLYMLRPYFEEWIGFSSHDMTMYYGVIIIIISCLKEPNFNS